MAYHGPVISQLSQPAALDPGLHLGCSCVARKQCGSLSVVGSQRQHLTGMWIRGSLLGKQVVAIIPECNQTKIVNRRVRGCSVADHDPDLPAQSCQKCSIPCGRSRFGHEHREARATKHFCTGFAESIKISLIWNDDHRAAPTLNAGACRRG
jgi:hypothetical protein